MRPTVLALLILLAVPAIAGAEAEPDRGGALRGVQAPPSDARLPAGEVAVEPALGKAGLTPRVTLSVRLDRAVDGATLEATLPELFTKRAVSGLAFAGRPRLRRGPRGAAVTTRGRTTELALGEANAGDTVALSVDTSGLPAGTYALPLTWRPAGGAPRPAGVARFTLVASRREGEEGAGGPFGPLRPARIETDASADSTEESETAVAVNPVDHNRLVATANDISNDGTGGIFVSDNAGKTFTPLHFPTTFNKPTGGQDSEVPSGDPIAAADRRGNIWVGGLSLCDTGSLSHIFVNRIAAGTDALRPANAAIPFFPGDGGGACFGPQEAVQDKPQMTIDNWPGSPHYGRLYVTWDDAHLSNPDKGAIDEVVSFCDTQPDASHCDLGTSWSSPVRITDSAGSYITSDPGVGPDGTVYVVWWDYSATNRIGIDRCAPTVDCSDPANWGADQTIAVLSTDSDPLLDSNQVPFACPIEAQPGGRAAPVPSIAADSAGKLYVAWSDLRANSGTTRCDTVSSGPLVGTPPSPTHQTFDSFVAAAPDYATLTDGATTTSLDRGTRIFNDTDTTPTAANSDDWFPWVAVDPSDDQAYVDVYSTTGDATRRTANFYLSTVTPPASGTRPTISAPAKLTAAPSDYSDGTGDAPGTCCDFGNDYGDYEGLAAGDGFAFPIWTWRANFTDDGDVHLDVAVRKPTAVTGAATAIGDTQATVSGTVNPGGGATTYRFEYGTTTAYGAQAPSPDGDAGSDAADHTVTQTLTGLASGTTYHYRVVASDCGGCGDGTAAGADRTFKTTGAAPGTQPPATTTPTTPPPTTEPADTTPPVLSIGLGSRRVDRKRRYRLTIRPTREPATGTVTLRRKKGGRRLARRSVATDGAHSLRVVLRLKRRDMRSLRRHHRLRVRVTVVVADAAGNRATARRTFTLRAPRRG